MDLLERLLGHDAWTTERLLQLSRQLSDAQLDQEFDIGNQSVRSTFAHMIGNVEVWTSLMAGRTVEPARAAITLAELSRRHEQSYREFAALARRVRDEQRWDDTYLDILDNPPGPKSFGGTVVHVITHNMTHRGEILHMLRRLGVPDLPEGDALSWEAATQAGGVDRFTGE